MILLILLLTANEFNPNFEKDGCQSNSFMHIPVSQFVNLEPEGHYNNARLSLNSIVLL